MRVLILFALFLAAAAQTFIAGQITLPSDLEVVDSKSFTCKPAHPGKKGDAVATRMSETESWSVATETSRLGDKQVRYPFMGVVNTSDGGRRGFFAATVALKVDIKAGEVVHSDGYKIEAKRAFKAGDPIPAIYFFSPILSVEAAQPEKAVGTNRRPALIISRENATQDDLKLPEEAWRAFEKHVVK